MFRSGRETLLLVATSVLLLTACDMSLPSQVNVRQIQVKETMRAEKLDAFHMDPARVNIIADHYLRNGRGPMRMTMAYQAGEPLKEIEMQKQARLYQKAFEQKGVSNIVVDYVPMADAAYVGTAVVSYPALTALPPKDCGRLTGYQGVGNLDDMKQYKVGCDTQAAMSRMIARPADLMGTAGTPDGDSRRQGGVVEKYKTGEPNERIDGINASDIGTPGG